MVVFELEKKKKGPSDHQKNHKKKNGHVDHQKNVFPVRRKNSRMVVFELEKKKKGPSDHQKNHKKKNGHVDRQKNVKMKNGLVDHQKNVFPVRGKNSRMVDLDLEKIKTGPSDHQKKKKKKWSCWPPKKCFSCQGKKLSHGRSRSRKKENRSK